MPVEIRIMTNSEEARVGGGIDWEGKWRRLLRYQEQSDLYLGDGYMVYLGDSMHVYACVLSCFSHVWLLATLWTLACQALLSMDYPGKNTRVGCHTLLQGVFLIQGSNPHLLYLLHWQAGFLFVCLFWITEPPGKPGWWHTYLKIDWTVYFTMYICFTSIFLNAANETKLRHHISSVRLAKIPNLEIPNFPKF